MKRRGISFQFHFAAVPTNRLFNQLTYYCCWDFFFFILSSGKVSVLATEVNKKKLRTVSKTQNRFPKRFPMKMLSERSDFNRNESFLAFPSHSRVHDWKSSGNFRVVQTKP